MLGSSGHLLVGQVSARGSRSELRDAGSASIAPTLDPRNASSPPPAQCKTDSSLGLPIPLPAQGSSNPVPNHLSTFWPHTGAQPALGRRAEENEVPHLRAHRPRSITGGGELRRSLAILSHTEGQKGTSGSPQPQAPFFCSKRTFWPVIIQRITPVAVVIPQPGDPET